MARGLLLWWVSSPKMAQETEAGWCEVWTGMLECLASSSCELQKPFSTVLGDDGNSSNILQSYAEVLLASMLTASLEPCTPQLIRLSLIIKMLANCQGH